MSTIRATNFQHASAAAPAIVLAADGTAAATVSGINSGPLAGFRNAIINGNFDIWQRGTSTSSAGYGAADRWSNIVVGSGNTQSRQVFTPGQTAVPGEPKFFCRQVVTSVASAGNAAAITQRIEDVRTFAGQQVTVSFWAKADAAKPIAVELQQEFGTGGSPSAAVTGLGVNKVTLSTSWQKITTTVTLPSISGKTLGTDDNDNLRLQIWFDAGSSFNSRTNSLGQQSGTFDIAQVQVEAGPVATPFERRPIGTELALCHRYYVQYGGTEFGGGSNSRRYASTGGVTWEAGHCAFPGQMRSIPNTAVSGSITYSNASSLSIEAASSFGARLAVSPTAAGVYSWTGATLAFDAEL